MLKKTIFFIVIFAITINAAKQNSQLIDWPLVSYTNAVEMLQKKGNANKTIAYLQKEMEPPFPFGFEPKPPVSQSTNKPPQTSEFYNKYPKGFKIGFYYYELLGNAFLKSGKPAEAFSSFLMSENLMPHKYSNNAVSNLAAQHFCNLAKTCGELSRYADSEGYCNYALSLCKSNNNIYADILITRATTMGKIGNFGLGVKIYKELYEKDLLKAEKDYVNYANLLFRVGKNKTAFDVLFDGLITISINDRQIENDPVINTIIDRITLANNEEIYTFHETLGDILGILNTKAGMEKSIAFIINERNLLTKIFGFLPAEQDLERIKERIKEGTD